MTLPVPVPVPEADAVLAVGRAPGWHPAVDEFDERFVVFATSSSTVRFTEPFAAFVAEAAIRRVRPVLVTTTTARVSPFVSLVMRDACGLWAVQARDGTTFDALTGYQVEGLGDLWARRAGPVEVPGGEERAAVPDRARLPGFADPSSAACRVLTFDVHTHQRAEASSRVGVVAETVAAPEAQWQAWSTREPLLEAWDVGAVTVAARQRMPESHTFRVAGTAGAFCQVQVARIRTGLLEHTVGGVPVPDEADVLVRATAMAQTLAETHSPIVAFVSLAEFDTDGAGGLGQGARARTVEAPVVALLGPRAVRELGEAVEDLARAHDVRTVGRARVPCLLVRFAGDVAQRWADVVRFGGELGGENVRRALGGPL